MEGELASKEINGAYPRPGRGLAPPKHLRFATLSLCRSAQGQIAARVILCGNGVI